MEFEEGEAYTYNTNRKYDECIDPDVALSYIDEKLQNVLGHFQKDFEGGVFTENLGAKYGGYGSFLPTCQRSPTWSHLQSSNLQSRDMTESSSTSQLEDACHSFVAPLAASQTTRNRSNSSCAISPPSWKEEPVNNPLKEGGSMLVEDVNSHEPMNRKNGKFFDSKMPKLKIKMGSDNPAIKKKVEIYSGLGLDVSPSSSLEDSHSESEDISPGGKDTAYESPTSIIQMMTSFPPFLSPLPDCLIHLTKREGHSGFAPAPTALVKDQRKGSEKKKTSAVKKIDASAELRGNKNQSNQDIAVPSKKKPSIDHLNFKEHVSKTSMPSNPSSTADDTAKSKGKASSSSSRDSKIPSRDIIFSDDVKEERSEVKFTEELGCIEKPKMCSNKTLSEADKETIIGDPPGHSRKDGRSWKDDTNDSESKLNAHKQRSISGLNQPRHVDSPGYNDQKVSSQEQGVLALRPGKVHSSSKGKGKLKGSQNDKSGSSSKSKSGKSIHKITPISRGGTDLESARNSGGDIERYREFFGEMEQDDEMKSEPMEMSPQFCQKESKESLKGKLAFTDTKEERSGGTKSKKDSMLGTHLNAISDFGTGSGNNPTLDVVPPAVAPVIIDEHWVGCDRCEKWRLLPPGKNPNDLPEKWQCRMLDWLPGKNKCSISQEETTNAVMAMFQAPVPYVQNEVHNAGIPASTLTNIHHSLEESMRAQSLGSGKRKNGVKKASYATNGDGRPSSSHSSKKNAQASKSKNMNDVKRFHPETEADWQQNSLSGELGQRKDNHKVLEHHSEGAGKIQKSNNPASMSVSKHDRGNKDTISLKEQSERVEIASDSGTMGARNFDERNVATKKRKSKEPLSALGRQLLDGSAYMNDRRKEKKAKNSEGKRDSASKGNGKSDRRSSDGKRHSMENNLRKSQNGPNGIASMAATSSSSKICGSHKSKASFQEMRGSPAESVSSSPIRSSKTNKYSSLRQTAKDDFHDASIFAVDCPDNRAMINQPQIGRDDESFTPTPLRSLKSPVFNCDRDHFSGRNSTTPDIIDSQFPKDDYSGKDVPYPSKLQHLEERKIDRNTHVNGLDSGKLVKHSSSQSKNKRRRFKYEGEINAKDFPDSFNGLEQSSLSKEAKVRDSNAEIYEDEFHYARKNESYKSCSNIKRKNDRDLGEHENVVEDAMFDKDAKDNQNHSMEKYHQRASKVSARGKAKQPAGPYQAAMLNSHKDKEVYTLEADDNRKIKINMKNDECPSGTKHQNSGHLASNGTSNHDAGMSGLLKKESLSQAATSAIKEAKALKHLADRVKTSGSNQERTGLYFQAALKFLHGASLLESSSSHSSKHGEMIQSVQMYGSTAKLCEFCAHEYEKSKDMASGALAYKCTEAAYMKVVYSSNSTVCRDRLELQAALKMIPPGESPPSSASDVINVNNSAAVDKNSLLKGINSPQNGGNHGVDAPNRSNITKLLSFAQDVDNAMVASRKARSAFAAASSKSGDAQFKEVISSIKKALDFNFHDVEELLRLVRLAMETINRG